jgi:hypothetical protein
MTLTRLKRTNSHQRKMLAIGYSLVGEAECSSSDRRTFLGRYPSAAPVVPSLVSRRQPLSPSARVQRGRKVSMPFRFGEEPTAESTGIAPPTVSLSVECSNSELAKSGDQHAGCSACPRGLASGEDADVGIYSGHIRKALRSLIGTQDGNTGYIRATARLHRDRAYRLVLGDSA